MNFFQKFRDFVASPSHSRTMSLLVILVLVSAVSLTVTLSQQQQTLKQHAATPEEKGFVYCNIKLGTRCSATTVDESCEKAKCLNIGWSSGHKDLINKLPLVCCDSDSYDMIYGVCELVENSNSSSFNYCSAPLPEPPTETDYTTCDDFPGCHSTTVKSTECPTDHRKCLDSKTSLTPGADVINGKKLMCCPGQYYDLIGSTCTLVPTKDGGGSFTDPQCTNLRPGAAQPPASNTDTPETDKTDDGTKGETTDDAKAAAAVEAAAREAKRISDAAKKNAEGKTTDLSVSTPKARDECIASCNQIPYDMGRIFGSSYDSTKLVADCLAKCPPEDDGKDDDKNTNIVTEMGIIRLSDSCPSDAQLIMGGKSGRVITLPVGDYSPAIIKIPNQPDIVFGTVSVEKEEHLVPLPCSPAESNSDVNPGTGAGGAVASTLTMTLNTQDTASTSADLTDVDLTLYNNLAINTPIDGVISKRQSFTKTSNISRKQYSASNKPVITSSLNSGTKYIVFAKKDNLIARSSFTFSKQIQITVPPATLVFGDVNNDNDINIQDYNILKDCWGKSTTSNPACAIANYDNNEVVEQIDYNALLKGLSIWSIEGKKL